MPIVEPEVLLDGEHDIDRTLEVAEATWAETFKYLADNKVMFEGILLKPSMVTPGAENPNRSTPEQVADYTLKLLTPPRPARRPRSVPAQAHRCSFGPASGNPACVCEAPVACMLLHTAVLSLGALHAFQRLYAGVSAL